MASSSASATSSPAHALARGPGSSPRIAIALDVIDLGVSAAFYERLMGFQTVAIAREDMIFESRAMRSPRIDGFELRLRAAFGRKPKGSSGGMLTLSFAVPDLAGFIASARPWARWLDEPPVNPGEPHHQACLYDPDGYLIELVQA